MKNKLTSLTLLLCLIGLGNFHVSAQAPEKFNYQGIARDAQGAPLANQALGLRITIRDMLPAGTAVYRETHTVNTNDYGLYTLSIGGGTAVSGAMADVNWGDGDKYVQVEMDPAGGTSYTNMGTTQLLSVPYAMYAGSGTRVSAFTPNGCEFLTNVTTSMTKIGDMGDFSKVSDNTLVELAVQTVINVYSFTGATGVVFELRVDDEKTTIGRCSVLLRGPATMTPVTLVGIFKNLDAGTHTVSLWVRGVNGTASDASWDSGCFNSFGVNNVLIKEFN